MADEAKVLMAHLMRRAGFGAPYSEVEARAAKGYEATVEELLHPETQPELDDDIMMRYKTEWVNKNGLEGQQEEWIFRMINTKRPLEEKNGPVLARDFLHWPCQVRASSAAKPRNRYVPPHWHGQVRRPADGSGL
jgi:hypothetical protein